MDAYSYCTIRHETLISCIVALEVCRNLMPPGESRAQADAALQELRAVAQHVLDKMRRDAAGVRPS